MYTSKLPPRKPDALDTWNDLFQQRYQAYLSSDWNTYRQLNNQLKDIRRNGGWSESEIEEEFKVYDNLSTIPFNAPSGNPNICYDVMVGGETQNLTLSINQMSVYWRERSR
jgi:hypothetical protein